MDSVLNLVYDSWSADNRMPIANGYQFCCENNLSCCDYNSPNNGIFMRADLAVRGLNVINVKNYKLSEIKDSPDDTFYYLVWYKGSFLHDFFQKNILPITNDVHKILKEYSNVNLIFQNDQEVEPKIILPTLENVAKLYEINPQKIWVINNDQKLIEHKEELNSKINIHTSRATSIIGKSILKNVGTDFIKFNENKTNMFLIHNRAIKQHRIGLLILLRHCGLLKYCDWSLIGNNENFNDEEFKGFLSCIFSEELQRELKLDISYFKNIKRKASNYELTRNWFDSNGNISDLFGYHGIFDPKTYENSYFNVATESMFLGNNIHITEKSFKPFIFLQFPLILATHQHIKYLKKIHNFDFFDDVVDNSYDNEKDNTKRLIMFVNEIKRITENKQMFIDFYKKNKDRFLSNQKIIQNINDNYDVNFFNSLANKNIQ